MTRKDVASRLSRLYDDRSLRSYVYWKVRTDPAYHAVIEHLRDDRKILDLGCGVGVLPFFLREHGINAPIIGVDHDERKIEAARRAATRYRNIDFIRADARDPLPDGYNVIVLDVLQYFSDDDQRKILAHIAAAVPPNGVAIFRQGIHDKSWRRRVTIAVDAFARVSRWMRAEKLNFPTRDRLIEGFPGFNVEIEPLWGRTPFNNYLFVFTRPATVRRRG